MSTSAGNCGLNCTTCSAVVHDGFPTSLLDLVQKMGRAGRSNILYNNPPVSCILVIISLIVLPTDCIHQQLEKLFEEPKDTFRITEPCRNSCWYCEKWWVPPVSKLAITKVLEHFAKNNPTSMNASALPKLLFDTYNCILWPVDHTAKFHIPSKGDKRDKKLRASAQWLVLALYLCNILFASFTHNRI